MDAPISIENVPFTWGMAFLINVVIGALAFISIIRKILPGWAQGCCCWIGWWSCANALTFVVNMVVGTDNPFSYHQMGVLTETMMNVGILGWFVVYMFQNWNVSGDHWQRMEVLRHQIAKEAIEQQIAKEKSHDPK